ncbi:2-hydroxyacyl-CoA dehydratase family protein [Hornefia butyriciproducens]|uniref:2-hydroxyacyl-CoA dehydratase family protein n=1 Tax=Hornefia butyriciproducens TaxID=2652293 RepID=UPI0029F6C1FF|nr:2-hydroxyacyl-CoA dehydratase family protein [Hornefia butyriciproducens]MDD7020736.1 2-hydroxyacyl-CoA dehydratase family protein [Hornefia butyriciproducens]MDY5462141.1 2-hydroxyacyl-CoA dehydratase family protein [Hornefia butyriciproducens]
MKKKVLIVALSAVMAIGMSVGLTGCGSGSSSGGSGKTVTLHFASSQGTTHVWYAFMYEPEKKRGQYMLNLAEQYNADAIVVMMMKFCDPEQYDYPIYKAELEAAGIPFLYMEVDQQTTGFEQLRTRIQSFCEMLM